MSSNKDKVPEKLDNVFYLRRILSPMEAEALRLRREAQRIQLKQILRDLTDK